MSKHVVSPSDVERRADGQNAASNRVEAVLVCQHDQAETILSLVERVEVKIPKSTEAFRLCKWQALHHLQVHSYVL